jgi:hypothetical protein
MTERITPQLCLFHAAIAYTFAFERVRPSSASMADVAAAELIAAARRWVDGDIRCERCHPGTR